MIWIVIFRVLMYILISLAIMCFIVYIAFGNARRFNMSKIDFAKDKDYYRDILKGYSPAELSYIDELKIVAFRIYLL